MAEESVAATDQLTVRDVFQQVNTRLGRVEEDVRGLREEMVRRFERVEEQFGELRAEMGRRLERVEEQFGELRAEMDRRFGRQTGLMVTILLALVIGIGGLWLK